MKIGVFGAGAWGTALAYICAESGNDVIHWGYNGIFDGLVDLSKPENVIRTDDMSDLKDCEYWLIVTPAAFFTETAHKMRQFFNNQPILICTKGMNAKNGMFMSEILNNEIPECEHIGVLSGPQFAREVATGVKTGSTLAGDSIVRAGGKAALSKLYFQETTDIIGTQICGVGKNAVSLISGYLTGTECGENERALFFTLAWDEIVEIGIKMGADYKTFLGLCGVGDLFLSATSPTSRNFSAGLSIAKGIEYTGTVEGISALYGLINRAILLNVPTYTLTSIRKKMKL